MDHTVSLLLLYVLLYVDICNIDFFLETLLLSILIYICTPKRAYYITMCEKLFFIVMQSITIPIKCFVT